MSALALPEVCGHLLRRVQQVHNALWLAEVGAEPTSPQYAVLAGLAAAPGSDQRSLGALASLDKSSTMEVVGRLERAGRLIRSRDPRDARRDILSLTSATTSWLAELSPRVQRVQRLLLDPVPSAEHPDLQRDLATLARLGDDVAADSPQRIPGHLVRRAQQVHTALFAEEFEAALTGPQFAVLNVVRSTPGIGQRELGEAAALDKSTAADIVDRLARRGWIDRDRDPDDGRRRLLSLSTEGTAATAEFSVRVAAVQERLLAPIEASRRPELLAALRLMSEPRD